MIYLDERLKSCFDANELLFDQIMALNGESFRRLEGRNTQRVILNGKPYFIKQHRGVGWHEVIKNLLQLRLPVISAKNEWLAIQKLQQLGINVPTIAGYGERGLNPATRESFVLMEELTPITSLEDLCRDWKKHPPTFALKQKLIKAAADIARVMHENGINHRDFYICHLLLDQKSNDSVKLYLIDLHRAQIRQKIPERWRVKDLAGLYFSSKDAGLSQRDYFRFMRYYRKKSLRDILQEDNTLWMKVKKRGDDLYRDHAK